MARAILLAHGQPSDPLPIAADLDRLAVAVAQHLPGWQVVAATLAEPGALDRALAGQPQGIVMPLFMAAGWFTRQAVPDRLRAAGAHVGPGGWQLAEPFGTAPAVQDLAVTVARQSGAAQVLLAAHGSGRSPAPAAVARQVADRISTETGLPCAAAFIEEDPRLEQATGYGADAACLPYFAMAGGHVTDDLPAALAEAGFAGRILPPLGTDARVPALIAGLVRDAAGQDGGTASS